MSVISSRVKITRPAPTWWVASPVAVQPGSVAGSVRRRSMNVKASHVWIELHVSTLLAHSGKAWCLYWVLYFCLELSSCLLMHHHQRSIGYEKTRETQRTMHNIILYGTYLIRSNSLQWTMFCRCECLRGFEGGFCEVNVDECLSTPCLNNALCEDHDNDFLCLCKPGFGGRHCDKGSYQSDDVIN